MDRAQLQRKTVGEEPDLWPGSQVFLDSQGHVWHDLKFVHVSLTTCGLDRPWKEYRGGLRRMWRQAEVQASLFYLCTAPVTHITNVCRSMALVMALWVHVGASRIDRVVQMCAAFLRTMCSRASEAHMATLPGALDATQSRCLFKHRQHSLEIRGGRQVSGWRSLIESLHPYSRSAWMREWIAMQGQGFLENDWNADAHALVDIVHFSLLYKRSRASQRKIDCVRSLEILKALRAALAALLAEALDIYILKIYLPTRAERPAPALVSPKKSTLAATQGASTRAPYTKAQPEAIWDLFAQARDSGASVEQIVVIRGHDAHVGCHPSRATFWLCKKNVMYRERRRMAFDGVHHLNIVADPSTHNKKDTMASLVWSWEVGVAAHGDLQMLPQAKTVLESEQDLMDNIARLAAQGRLERVATFRQLQALSNVIRSLGHWQGLQDFVLPPGWGVVRAVQQDEVRVVREQAVFNQAQVVNRRTREVKPVVPVAALASLDAALAATQGINLLVLGLDQGSIGAAGCAFSDSLEALVHCKWDKFHRVIRDINLEVEHTCHGLFLKVRLFTSYLWGINQKPYGTGLFGTEKKHILNVFLATCSIDTPVFRKYMPRIAACAGIPVHTRDEQQTLFNRLPDLARSWCQTLDISKLGRWFSWNGCADEQLGEFWVSKMLLEHYLEDMSDPDENPVAFDDLLGASRAKTPQAELARLKAANGGLRLAYRLMSTSLWQYAKILFVATRGCWTWYCKQVKRVQKAKHSLASTLAASQGAWHADRHLSETVRDALLDRGSLAFMGIPLGESLLADRLLRLTWGLIGRRTWSLAARLGGPPESYVGLLSPEPLSQHRAIERLRVEWKALLSLELLRLTNRTAEILWADIHFARNTPIRVMFVLFELGKFQPDFLPGKRWLRGLLDVLPDNKIIEEVHHGLKQDAKRTQSSKRNSARQQDVAISTPVLSTRGIPHSAVVTKDFWIREFRAYKRKSCRREHYPVKHEMPKQWTKVMGPKTWATVSESVSHKGIAAWQWLQVGFPRVRLLAATQGQEPPGLDAAMFSLLALPQLILQRTDSAIPIASLGHATWAVLFYPMDVVRVGENGWRTLRFRSAPAATFFDYVTDPRDWQAVPYRSVRDGHHGIVLEQCSDPEPLLRASLRQCQVLSHDLLMSVAALLALGLGEDAPRRALLEAIAAHVSDGSQDFVAAVMDQDEKTSPVAVATLLGDPVFEAAFQEMPDDDKGEFPEVRKELARGRVRQHLADRARQAKRRRQARPLPRRRVRQRRGEPAAPPGPGAVGGPAAPPGGPAVPPAALPPAAPPPAGPPPAGGEPPAPPPPSPPPPAGRPPPPPAPPPPPPAQAGPGRVPRGVPWDRHRKFWIARTHRGGQFQAVTVTCLAHTADDLRCNKSFTPGRLFTEAEATIRIKEWCARGLDIPDQPGGKVIHMDINPREFGAADIRSEADLLTRVNA